ncbi:hypothetical protein METBIDRAFT_47773, partial [Metschnikowia bicuspidata var. bicuspidata NRRL YB-4993]
MSNQPPADGLDPALYFLSTQIQANYEDQEHKDTKVSQLHKFRKAVNSPTLKIPKPAKVAKSKRKTTKKATRPINSISAFVRETLGGKKPADPQTLLDQFLGDQTKLDKFLNEVEAATATPHLLSKKPRGQDSLLFSGPEWKDFSERLRLKFPNLSKGNRKSLK